MNLAGTVHRRLPFSRFFTAISDWQTIPAAFSKEG